ncbi:unnamed protein product [Owenia fusiformis]|nr:unnamed protein product [Owenia fusiformis]
MSESTNSERGNWTGKLDFILSCIGFSVGLGNVWRFPYLAYENGGGAFLIPYAIMLLVCGLPLYFMELALAQFCSRGPVSCWTISPMFKGLGYAMVIISSLVCIYYNVIIAWAIFYLCASFTSELPWQHCGNVWNTDACMERNASARTFIQGSNITLSDICSNSTLKADINDSTIVCPTAPSQEFWNNYVLEISSGIEETGIIRWPLALCLLLAWIVVFLCLSNGIKSSGKVVYFTALFPYVVLIILLVRGVTLEGYWKGVEFYIIPEWEQMKSAKVWGAAATQIFYSLGVGFGGLHAMSSYNKFHNNVYRDAVIIAVINCATSVFAGFVVFSVLGHMAHRSNVEVKNVVDTGPGLAFVAYPEGVALMPIAPLWSILFFLMIFTLGLDSQFAMMETVITGLTDEFPVLRKWKTLFTMAICIVFFFLGLPMVTNSGMYWLHLMNWYSAGFSLMFVTFFEIVAIHIYGLKNFLNDIKMMIGFRPNPYWIVTWAFVTPAAILFIIGYSFYDYGAVTYTGNPYPEWGEIVGWLMVVCSAVMIPLFIVIECCKRGCKGAAFHTPEWGPALAEHRALDARYHTPDSQMQAYHNQAFSKDQI